MEQVGVGIIGCGNISGIYLQNLCGLFKNVKVLACADLIMERSQAKAEEHAGVKAMTVDELLADPDIEIVVNLTTPDAHFDVAMQSIEAGKNVHNEKPVVLTREQGRAMLDAATAKGLRVGCAPDTFMGGGIQTCRKLINDGWVGEPIGAHAFMLCHGHESWHPDPAFYYKTGGGPMFDMGPYYLTALVALIGPVARVTGSTRITFPQRTVTSEPKYGEIVDVEVPTHVTGVLEFGSGAIGTITTSFDVWGANVPYIEIFGTEGSLSVPDPNYFHGPVRIKRKGASDWGDVPLSHGYTENSRGLGPADMAASLRSGRAHRANGELAYHVLDIMHAVHDAADQGKHITLESTCESPAPMPMGLRPGTLDA